MTTPAPISCSVYGEDPPSGHLCREGICYAKPGTCEHQFEAWGPHEGCAEFMVEPETWLCGDRATATVVVTEPDVVAQDGSMATWEMTLCEDHALQLTSELAVEPADITYTVRTHS